jgi:glutamate carboxypeptidase
MFSFSRHLDWIDIEYPQMITLLNQWTNINSGSENLEGLSTMMKALQNAFSPLGGRIEEISLPPRSKICLQGTRKKTSFGKVLSITKRPYSQKQVLLGGHMDIAYGKTHPLEKSKMINNLTLKGRGSADMKGGLLILLNTLKTIETSPYADKIGWRVLINPDEEIGSLGSAPLFKEAAKYYHFGMLFEPSYSDGSLVSSRKGSFNFTLFVEGKAAHAGRDFFEGSNALTAAAKFALAAESLTNRDKEITVNIGALESPGAVNIVPDKALCRFNIRAKTMEDLESIKKIFNTMVSEANEQGTVKMTLTQDTANFPKIFDTKTEQLFMALRFCAQTLGFNLTWRSSGGVCDGNILANAGLPTVDTLGVVGGDLHTAEEYVHLPSLKQRSKLSALLILQFAAGEFKLEL